MNMHRPLAILLCYCLGPLLGTPATAQESSDHFWATVGVGVGVAEDLAEEVAGVLELVFQSGAHRLSARGSAVTEVLNEGVSELGLLYGRALTGDLVYAALSAGAAWVSADHCEGGIFSPQVCETESTVGLPVTATLTFRLADFLGLGVQAFGNVNSARSFGGGAVVIELGDVR